MLENNQTNKTKTDKTNSAHPTKRTKDKLIKILRKIYKLLTKSSYNDLSPLYHQILTSLRTIESNLVFTSCIQYSSELTTSFSTLNKIYKTLNDINTNYRGPSNLETHKRFRGLSQIRSWNSHHHPQTNHGKWTEPPHLTPKTTTSPWHTQYTSSSPIPESQVSQTSIQNLSNHHKSMSHPSLQNL